MLARKTVFGLCAFLAISIQAGSVRAQPLASEQEDAQRIGDLVIANHILADQNILDAWGHVSIRSTGNPKHFYLSRSVAPALVKPEDIMEYDEDSNPVDARGRALYLEASSTARCIVRGRTSTLLSTATRPPLSPSA